MPPLLVVDEGDGDDVDFLLDLDTILYPGSVNCADHYRGNFPIGEDVSQKNIYFVF